MHRGYSNVSSHEVQCIYFMGGKASEDEINVIFIQNMNFHFIIYNNMTCTRLCGYMYYKKLYIIAHDGIFMIRITYLSYTIETSGTGV